MGSFFANPAIQHLIAGLASLGTLGGLLAVGVDPNHAISTALVGVIALLVGSTATALGANSVSTTTNGATHGAA